MPVEVTVRLRLAEYESLYVVLCRRSPRSVRAPRAHGQGLPWGGAPTLPPMAARGALDGEDPRP